MTDAPADKPDDPGPAAVERFLRYSLSIPERALRSTSALVGGALHESGQLLVPQAFRTSTTYSVMVQQMLDFMVNDVGGVPAGADDLDGRTPPVENFVARKTVGNFVELAGLATFHLSPLTMLALVSDIAYGSQVYLQELAVELQREGLIDDSSTIHSVDDLLRSVSAASQTTARAFDTPPLSVEGLRATIEQTRAAVADIDPTVLLPQAELERIWRDVNDAAAREGVSPLALSGAMAMYTLSRVASVGRGAMSTIRVAGTLVDRTVLDHYAAALDAIQRDGFYAVVRQCSGPYIEAVWRNFASDRPTITDDVLSGKLIGQAWTGVRRWLLGKADAVEAPADPEHPA